jgi:hypothetical protein
VRELLNKNSKDILEVYRRADYKNLRTLRNTIVEFERFYDFLSSEAKDHSQFMADCVHSFFIINIELSKGAINTADIKILVEKHQEDYIEMSLNRGKSDVPVSEIFTIMEKYFGTSPGNMTPNEESLFYFFEYGLIPDEVMTDAINGNAYFVKKTTPSWIKLWHTYELPDADFPNTLKTVKDEFEKHVYTNQGVLKHVAGILLLFARNEIIEQHVSTISEYLLTTINKMIELKLIKPLKDTRQRVELFDDGYGGLGFYEYKTPEFQSIVKLLKKYEDDCTEDTTQEDAPKLIELLGTDSRKFYQMLNYSDAGGENYSQKPILHLLDPRAFLEAMIKAPPMNRRDALFAIQERYKFISTNLSLIEELQWLSNLDHEIEARLPSMTQPSKYHVQSFRKSLQASIQKVHQAKLAHEEEVARQQKAEAAQRKLEKEALKAKRKTEAASKKKKHKAKAKTKPKSR